VLHSFGIPDAEGDVWLAYLDSESDKELVIAAVRPAGVSSLRSALRADRPSRGPLLLQMTVASQ
jgi:hypothetical protein